MQDFVAGGAKLYLAAVGSVAPADESAVLDAAWKDTGIFTEDGTGWEVAPTFQEARSHQSSYPTRIWKSAENATLNVGLQKFSARNLTASLGGGVATTITAGHFKWTPPGPTGSVPTAALLELTDVDGTNKYRLVIPKCRARSNTTTGFNKTQEVRLPLSLGIEGADGTDAYYWLTNDADFDPTA